MHVYVGFCITKNHIFCFITLRDNLFECSHSMILLSSLFIISIKVATFFPVKNKFESSAYRIVNNSDETFTISFM